MLTRLTTFKNEDNELCEKSKRNDTSVKLKLALIAAKKLYTCLNRMTVSVTINRGYDRNIALTEMATKFKVTGYL
jgi:hypothetical protein